MATTDWTSLRHAYGPAGDIPSLLDKARRAPPPSDHRSEPWFSLWSALYHQDDIYSASYAAVPELVGIASDVGGAIAAECLLLASSIELRRHTPNAPSIPSELEARYLASLPVARALAAELVAAGPDTDGKAAVADAVFRGDFARARALFGDIDSDE